MRTALPILTVVAGVVRGMRGGCAALPAATDAPHSPAAADALHSTNLRGKLVIRRGKPAVLETADHKVVTQAVDKSTSEVLGDARMNGFEVKAWGHFSAPGQFLINPVHTRAMMVRKDGRLQVINCWCDVCSLRSYTLGPMRVLPEGNHRARPDRSR